MLTTLASKPKGWAASGPCAKGVTVFISGLKAAPELNSTIAVVVDKAPKAGRWFLKTRSRDGLISLKEENMTVIKPAVEACGGKPKDSVRASVAAGGAADTASSHVPSLRKLSANHDSYDFLQTEQEMASRNNDPTIAEHPIKLFDLQGLGVDLQQMATELGPTYDHLPWDLYLLKRDHVEYLAHCFPERRQALMIDFLPKYFAGLLHEADLAEHLESLSDEQLQEFNRIKPYRRRGISSFLLHKCEGGVNDWWRIEDLPHGAYAQSNTLVNNDYRSLTRAFPPSPPAVTQNLQFRQVLVHLAAMTDKCRSGATKTIKITCQQVGIVTDPNQIVSNAPEGIHQDGCDYIVSALVLERNGIAGGQSVVFGPDKATEYLRHTLQDGQGIFQADMGSPLWHVVEAIRPATMGQATPGIRNIIGYDIWVEE